MKRNRLPGRLPFAEAASRYMCCCLCCACHVRTGALVIGVVDALSMGGNLYRLGELYFTADESPSLAGKLFFFTVLLLFFWNIVAIITLFAAVCMDRPRLLLPKLGLQLVTLGLLMALGVASIVYFFIKVEYVNSEIIAMYENIRGDGPKMTDQDCSEIDSVLRTTFGAMLVVVALSIVIELWFFSVVLTCYKYLSDKQRHLHATVGELQPMTANGVGADRDDCCFTRLPLNLPPPYAENAHYN